MINLKTNEVFKIEVQSTDNFKSGDVDIFFFQDNSPYGLDNEKIGEININLDDKTYSCLYCGSFDEEEFYSLADKIILNRIRALGEKEIPDFGRIKDNAGEILKKFLVATGIEHTLKSEIEILQESGIEKSELDLILKTFNVKNFDELKASIIEESELGEFKIEKSELDLILKTFNVESFDELKASIIEESEEDLKGYHLCNKPE